MLGFFLIKEWILYYRKLCNTENGEITMKRIRIKRRSDLIEYRNQEEPDYIRKTEDKLYELHREIQELEERKINLQYKIKQQIEKLKALEQPSKQPTQNELFQYCNNLSKASKGSLNKN